MKEIWKDIPGYEGLYQASNMGNIRSLNYNHTGKPGNLAIKNTKAGYSRVHLCVNYKSKICWVHILVYSAFNHKVDTKIYDVHHKNHIPYDNMIENLELVERQKHHKEHGKEQSKAILQFDKNNKFIQEFKSIQEAKRALGKSSPGAISACLQGKQSVGYGFIWKYKKEKPEIL